MADVPHLAGFRRAALVTPGCGDNWPCAGIRYVDSELVQRISAAAEGEELSGAMLTQVVDMVEGYVQGLSGGETRDALTELLEICRRQAELGAAVWIET